MYTDVKFALINCSKL